MKVREDSGRHLDAQVELTIGDDAAELVVESRGPERNTDYIPAFDLLVRRLAANSAELLGIELASREATRPLNVRGRLWPVILKPSENTETVAQAIRNAAAAAGRRSGAKGPGNTTKRLRIRFRLPVGTDMRDRELVERIVGPGASRDATIETQRTASQAARVTARERRQHLVSEKRISELPDLSETEKTAVIKQRLAQRLFRERLKAADCRCRVTGITNPQHLRASHVKPWAECDDRERQDPANGLLLAPHVDHLFDEGYLSFENDGTVLVSPQLERGVLEAWGLVAVQIVAGFSSAQAKYLEYHRTVVFKRS